MVTTYITIFGCLIFSIYYYFKRTYDYWEKRNLPYLKPVMPFGNIWKVYKKTCSLGEAYSEAYFNIKNRGAKHGGVFVINSPIYMPVDLDIIKRILITDSDNFIDHGFYSNVDDDQLTAHMFNLQGSKWKDVRAKSAQAFTSSKLKNMFGNLLSRSEEFHSRLEKCIEKYSEGINIKNELSNFIVDVTTISAFGMVVDTLKGKNKNLLKHVSIFMNDQWNLYKNTMMFVFPPQILKFFKFRVFSNESTAYVKNMFLSLKADRKKIMVETDDLANIIIRLSEEQKDHTGRAFKASLSSNEYIAQMWMFLCGSAESSSTIVSFALYELARNLECQIKLRNEISSVLSKHDNEITYEAVAEMSYIDCVLDGKIIHSSSLNLKKNK